MLGLFVQPCRTVLVKGFAVSHGCPGGLGTVGGGKYKPGRDIAKGERDHEVFQGDLVPLV